MPKAVDDGQVRQVVALPAIESSLDRANTRLRLRQDLCEVACRTAVEQNGVRLAWVGVYRPALDRVEPAASHGADSGFVESIWMGLRDPEVDRGPVARAMRSGAPVIANDLLADEGFQYKVAAQLRGLRACAAFPLRLGDDTIGVLATYADTVGFFTDGAAAVLTSIAERLQSAVVSLGHDLPWPTGDEGHRNGEDRIRLFHRLAEVLREGSDPDQVLRRATRLLGEHFRCSVAYADVAPDGDSFAIPYDYVVDGPSRVGHARMSDYGPRIAGLFRSGDAPVVIEDAEALEPEEAEALRARGIRSFVCFTLVRQGGCRAMMSVHQPTPRVWKPNELRVIHTFVERCWATIEQRAVEAKLRNNEALLRIAGRAARIGGYDIEVATGHVTWSDEACAIHEVPAGTTPTMAQAATVVAPEHRARVEAAFVACASGGPPVDVETQAITATGKRIWMRIFGHAVFDRTGALERLQGAVQDISDRRQLEEQVRQAQKMEAIGQLAGGIAHDLNNILSVILTYTEIISDDLEPGGHLRDDLDEIRRASQRAAELTRQLLAFGRQQMLQPRIVDLGAIASGLGNMLGRLLGADVELVLRLGAVDKVRADPGQIEQVIMNLVVNARDAMPEGGTLTVEVANTLDGAVGASGRFVMLAVSDSGDGIAPEIRDRIFEPFFTTKAMGKGTGLGLSTVHGIVTQSGGHVVLESELGHGTTFRVYLPRVDDPDEPIVEPALPLTARAAGETVLVVEDDPQVRVVVGTILERSGYRVLSAHSGTDALRLAAEPDATVDLVLTDLVMPRMSGREVAQRLASLYPAAKVLFMSGYTQDAAMRVGVVDRGIAFLAKPITPDTLLRKVREVLDSR